MLQKNKLDKKEMLDEIKNNIATIKRPIEDEFSLIQRLLSFCPELYYISDNNLKNKVIEKLNILKDTYNNDPY